MKEYNVPWFEFLNSNISNIGLFFFLHLATTRALFHLLLVLTFNSLYKLVQDSRWKFNTSIVLYDLIHIFPYILFDFLADFLKY